MHTSIAVLLALCISVSLHGQGVIGFDNTGALAEEKVYIDDWLNPSALAPGGTQFLVALYFSPVEGDESSLMQVGNATGFIGTSNERYGIFFGGGRTVQTIGIGGAGFFQVKGWEASYGTTYEEALANPSARTGKCPIFIADTANRITATEPVFGLVANSFSSRPFRGFVIAVPEPSTSLLGLAALVALLLAFRAKRK